MFNSKAARRIVAIQDRLVSEAMPTGRRNLLLSEQRETWEREFPGVPFERIARRAEMVA